MLKNLKFQNDNRVYDIAFNRIKVLQIKGDSSTGKSLLASDIKEQRDHDRQLGKVLVINIDNSDLLELVRQSSEEYNYIVIDNADVILDEETDKIIWKKIIASTKTYWIILGRKFFNCTSYNGCNGILKQEKAEDKHYFSIDYTTNTL